MFRKVIDYFNLRKVGGIEFFFACIPILGAYGFYGFPLQTILFGLLFLALMLKPKMRSILNCKILITMIVYVLIHDFLYLFIANGNINGYIQQVILFGCLLFGVRAFDLEKLKASLNFIAIISILGLLYQWGIIATGGDVHPIQIPFLDMPLNRINSYSIRPSSFFMEPASYVAFMYVPLVFSLIDKKFVWSIIIVMSEFLTTSTTGLLTSFIMLIVYFFTQKNNYKIRLSVILLGAIMVYSLIHFEVFRVGVEKFENIDMETNVRLTQGPYVVSTMESHEMIFGAQYHSAYDYCLDGRAPNVVFYKEEVYMSTIWMLILKYGYIGLFLYLMFYFKIAKANRKTIPLVACLIAVMFSSNYGLGGIFIYTSIPLLIICYDKFEVNEYSK